MQSSQRPVKTVWMQTKPTERKEELRDGERQQDLMIIFRILSLKNPLLKPYVYLSPKILLFL